MAQLKFDPLSENISRGRPRLAMNRLRATTKASATRSDTGSRWATLVVKHTKTLCFHENWSQDEWPCEVGACLCEDSMWRELTHHLLFGPGCCASAGDTTATNSPYQLSGSNDMVCRT